MIRTMEEKTMHVMVAMVATVLMTMGSAGGVPSQMNYQGRLLDSEGRPLNTNVTVSIALHTNDTGGAAVYTEAVGPVTVVNGIYGFHFGDNAAAVKAALGHAECWLEVEVGGTTLSPRHRLVATPYALLSSEVEGSGKWDEAYEWGDHGTNGYLTSMDESDPVAQTQVWANAQYPNATLTDGSRAMTGPLVLPAGGLAVGTTQLVVTTAGYVGIGTASPTNELAVNGTVKAKEVIVTLDGWADYVFEPGYALASLEQVEDYIDAHGHLPGVPSATEVGRGGVSLGAMQIKLLEKVEELTLHMIRLERENRALRRRVELMERTGD
jgi:hypothetical protein